MKRANYPECPSEIQSRTDGRDLSRKIAQNRVGALGVYAKNILVFLATSVGMAFTVLMDFQTSGTLGKHYFEPLPGEADTGIFGAKSILAATLLSALIFHLSTLNKAKPRIVEKLEKWSPAFGLVFILGAALLLMSTMAGNIHPELSSDWGDEEASFLSSVIQGFNTSLLSPVAQQAFAIGFGFVLLSSVVALSKLFEWWCKSLESILTKATLSGSKEDSAQRIKDYRIEFRKKAALYNVGRLRSEKDEETAFALMVFQTSARVVSDLRSAVNKNPDKQFGNYGSPATDITPKDINALARACTYERILAAVRGEDTPNLEKK